MVNIDRVRVVLTGFPGGPGVATHYGTSGPALAPFVHALWDNLLDVMPDNITAVVQEAGDTINDADGTLVGSWSTAPYVPLFGAQVGAYSAPAGACITWLTADIRDRHRIKGRTFVVPLGNLNYEANGSLTSGTLTGLNSAAAAYVTGTASNAVVWHRPRAAAPATATAPAVTFRAGSRHTITGSRVVDTVAVLRSRRD